MPSGFQYQGTDLDSIFEPLNGGTAANATGFVAGDTGQDLNSRYARAVDGTQIAQPTGFVTPFAADLQAVFAALGSVSLWDGSLADMPFSVNSSCSEIVPNNYALSEILFYPDGTIRQRVVECGAGAETTIGRWDGAVANSSNTEIRFEYVSGDVGSGFALDTWTTISFALGRIAETTQNPNQNQPDQQTLSTIRVLLREINKPATQVTKNITLIANYGQL
ncbi:hypothetical protein [Alishewanella phage vB_AspM_Slicko01]|nr:hypothetical protein [Alishewanella phage vB_AspM_Slicko01]